MAAPVSKQTRVARALLSPKWECSPLPLRIPAAEFKQNTFVPRLSFKPTVRVPAHEARLIDTLQAADNYALFMDTSVVGRRIDYPLFDELLRVPERLFLVKRVFDELLPHFASVRGHPLLKALEAKNPAVVLHPEPEGGSERFTTLLYYINLLARRREVLKVALARYVREHGAEPDENERAKIIADVQSDFGERGMLLCQKPISPTFTDETLVYLAVEHALRSGQPTIILTSDPDVEEQFFKLIELVTIHYYAMLIAREYHANFAAFKPRVLAGVELEALSQTFESVTLLDLGGRRIHDFRPPKIEFVPISCCLLGTHVSHVVYGAETAMSEVLDIKARTGGRSTDLLGERDLHAYFMPPIAKSIGSNSALISRDRGDVVPGTNLLISKLDGLAAINTRLSMSNVVMAPQSSRVLLRRRSPWAPPRSP
jgi:hypothetical protein